MSPMIARAALAGLLCLFAAAATRPSLSKVPAGSAVIPGVNDNALFTTVVARLRAGTPYYDAMHAEMTARSYPTASVFNWRTPLVFRLMTLTGTRAAWWLLAIGCGIVLVFAVPFFEHRVGAGELVLGMLALVGAFLVILAPSMLAQTEVWCGVLVAMSTLAYASGYSCLGAGGGLAALFVRELAAPYCVVCSFLSVRTRRWREAAMWIAGAAAYAGFFAYHVVQVWSHQNAVGRAAESSWMRGLGLPFLLEVMRECNSVLLSSPRIVTALFVTLVTASLFAPRAPVHLRASVLAFMVFFLVVGQQFNDYWGSVAAPLFAIAVAFGLPGVSRLFRDARSAARP